MNPRIRWVGAVLLLLFVVLFVQLNNIQVRQSSALSKNPLAEVKAGKTPPQPRGAILSQDLKILAYSKPAKGTELRIYPSKTAVDFGQITGYFGATGLIATQFGIEAKYNSSLSEHPSAVHSLGQLASRHQVTDNVILTMPSTLQSDAASLLAGHDKSEIVAIDPRNGDVLAMYGYPSYNPNLLAAENQKSALAAYNRLAKQYPQPFLNAASAVPYAPGSTFKIIDTAAIFDRKPSLASKTWPQRRQISIKGASSKFHNYAYATCGGPLAQILAQSCDTAYALVGLGLGAHNVVSEAKSFGWCEGAAGTCKPGGSSPPLDLPPSEISGATMAPESQLAANPPYLAYSSIGQYQDVASALSMALVGAAIADNGKIMAPHLMSKIVDSAGNVVTHYRPHLWKQATSAATAAKVRQLMLGVTQTSDGGTAGGVFDNLQAQGIEVAAKTGTAEAVIVSSAGNCATDDWLVAMAPAGAGQIPKAVVAAEVHTPNGATGCSEATGASIAGPIVDKMLTDVLNAGR